MEVLHAKQSGLPADDGDATKVQPSDWYADHDIDPAGTVIDEIVYTRPTDGAIFNSNATTPTAIDTTNLSKDVTVPPNGVIVAEMEAMSQNSNTGNVTYFSVLIAGTAYGTSWVSDGIRRARTVGRAAGLTPGATVTVRAAAHSQVSGSNALVYGGPTYGSVVLTIRAGAS